MDEQSAPLALSDDAHVVINCGHPEGPQETLTTFGQVAEVVAQHEAENQAARERQASKVARIEAARVEAERQAAERQAQQHAAQTAALAELSARAQTNPDLALIARVLGLPI